MAGMQLEFDEHGGSFYYFFVSFYALILFPLTYYFWPTDVKDTGEQNKKKCHCDPCQMKRHLVKSNHVGKGMKRKLVKLIFVIAWIGFLLVVYKVSQVEMEWTEFNPFAELGVDRDASTQTIRKAYKQLSLKFHPDKGGDPKRFMRLAKAYAALTNEQSRKNWQEYGNPDGPEAAQFGIALPKWIVEKKNSVWVLGVYGLVFMIILPVSVGTWWYRTIKFSGDSVLMDTTRLFFYFFHRSPAMTPKRIIMILTGAFEFDKTHNSEIIERPTDNQEVPVILKHLDHVNIKTKEKPFCYPYSIKTRSLIHSHLSRLDLPPKTLLLDQQMIIRKCPYLINEMINVVAQLVALGHAGRVMYVPRLETLEYCMKLCPMIVQALWENQSPMLQLPHITEDMLRHFVTRKRNIKTIRQLAEMAEDERRTLLRTLTDDQYRDLINVLSNMPLINMDCHCEVMDEEDPSITAGSIVTVTVRLTRRPMSSLFPTPPPGSPVAGGVGPGGSRSSSPSGSSVVANAVTYSPHGPLYSDVNNQRRSIHEHNGSVETVPDDCTEDGDGQDDIEASPKKKPQQAVWEKNRKKRPFQQNKASKSKKSNKPKGGQTDKTTSNGVVPVQQIGSVVEATNQESEPEVPKDESPRPAAPKSVREARAEKLSKERRGSDSENESGEDDWGEGEKGEGEEEEDGWNRFQEEARRENSLDTKEKTTHQVHAPFFPSEKVEGWWAYIADRKTRSLITAPTQIVSLQTDEETHLKFTAPPTPGTYVYNVFLRSDSYLDLDNSQTVKMVVKEAKLIADHPQWRLSDDDGDKSGGESGVETDSEGSDTDYDYDD